MSLLYATLSRKCLRSIGDKELSLSSAGIKDVPGDFVGTDTLSILSELYHCKHLCHGCTSIMAISAVIG